MLTAEMGFTESFLSRVSASLGTFEMENCAKPWFETIMNPASIRSKFSRFIISGLDLGKDNNIWPVFCRSSVFLQKSRSFVRRRSPGDVAACGIPTAGDVKNGENTTRIAGSVNELIKRLS
ncbi:MAG TPA: hypothetical protein IAA50_00055 [Candidatus Alistipes pullistercoris]|nr:hypothetical protein [Candidatus Alistipes pullistercoris]